MLAFQETNTGKGDNVNLLTKLLILKEEKK